MLAYLVTTKIGVTAINVGNPRFDIYGKIRETKGGETGRRIADSAIAMARRSDVLVRIWRQPIPY